MAVQSVKKRVFEPFSHAHRRENKERMKEFFVKRLDKALQDNQDRKKPYFITYKLKFDYNQPWVAKDIMMIHDDVPSTMVAGTILYRVDNSKGECELVRVVEP